MKLTKGKVALIGLVPALAEIVTEWRPAELSSERHYRDSLLAYLRKAIPNDCHAEREYRHNGTTTDLYVRWSGVLSRGEAFIEVKLHLDKKPQLDRLVGQLEALEPGERSILVVLVGMVDAGLLGRLKSKYAHLCGADFEEPLEIVVKERPARRG